MWSSTCTRTFIYLFILLYMYTYTCTMYVYIHLQVLQVHIGTTVHWSTVGFRWSWAWNDERGEWEFEKLNKITQYRHNINTSIKKRVILSFYNVSCSLSDTWFADKRKNIFFTRPTNIFFHFWFDVFMIFDFFDPNWVPCETCGGKILPVFQFPSK